MKIDVTEAGGSLATAQTDKPHTFRARLIAGDIHGSSGYYPREVIERDGPIVFKAGTQCFLDHPTESEGYERPERSVRDLAGVIASTPVYESDGLYADVRVYPQWAPVIEAMADDIGMSIRASGTYEMGERDGQQVKVITSLKAGESVDFVTKAGAGGKIVRLIESARTRIREATANDTRMALDSALTDKFGADKTWTWVRDWDATTVWYEMGTPDSDGTYALGYTITDDAVVTLSSDEPVEVSVKTSYVPVSSAGGNTTSTITEESKETLMPKIEIDEAEHRRLTEAATALTEANARADKAETERDAERAKVAESGARTDATDRATALLEKVEVRAATKARIIESVTVGLPMADGKLDVAAFEQRVNERATSEAAYEAALLKEAGVGTVSGEGGTEAAPLSESETKAIEAIDSALTREFEAMGLSESQAKSATAGRG